MNVSFHNIAAGGDGVGRDENGRTVFAPYAAPGDVARVDIFEEKKSFARGHILQLETASPQRIAPPCPYYVPQNGDEATACGGCQIQHLNYTAQLKAKREIVRSALMRIGGIENPPIEECVPSPQQFGYRNKAEFFAGDDGALGFHARGTHKVIDIARCPLLLDPLNEMLAALRDELPREAAKSCRMRADSQGATALEVVWLEDAVVDKKAFFAAMRARVASLIDPNRQQLEEVIDGLKFRLGAFDFFQVNPFATPHLVGAALELAEVKPGERALDLFCGAGLFGLFMAREGARVEGVDVREHLTANAKLNNLNTQGTRRDAAKFLRALAARDENIGQYKVALLDPPRAGAAESVESLARLRPARIVYVSCDPATLARDLKQFTARGYGLTRVVPVDMFPQTAHVETVALLQNVL
jgi:23S rRNA (uracil1939-C5)-methyltransferase